MPGLRGPFHWTLIRSLVGEDRKGRAGMWASLALLRLTSKNKTQ
jgi:hypothetical protein